MKIEELGLSHKGLLYERLRDMDTKIAEYSFPNLYLFRNSHQYKIIIDREIFVCGISYDKLPYIMPVFNLKDADLTYVKEMMKTCGFLFPVDEKWLSFFSGEEFDITSKDGDTDYVYTVEKMSKLAGRRLHAKRNLLARFDRLYSHEEYPLTNERLNDARYILDNWQGEAVDEEGDYVSCKEALDLYDELVLCGGIYYAEGEPAGFIIGEELDPETFALHFAKGLKKFKGIYQYIFNNFAGILPAKYRFMNLEQDLDIENLRVMKSSYNPDMLVRKMRVGLKA